MKMPVKSANLFFGNMEALQLVGGQVDSVPLTNVLPDVPEHVGELVGNPEAQGCSVHWLQRAGVGVRDAHDSRGGQPHGAGNPVPLP